MTNHTPPRRHLSAIAAGLVASLPLLLTALPAAAQTSTGLKRVEISGRADPVRADVFSACPDVSAQLQQSLKRVQYRVGREAELQVDFRLDGKAVVDVSTSGGPFEYRGHTRRAVAQLSCAADGQAQQHYRFIVAFLNERDEDGGGQRIALRAAPTARL